MSKLSIILAALVLAACGLPASRAAGPRAADRDPVAAIGRVVCDEDGTRVLTPRLRAHRDGIHVMFINRSSADEFYMRGANNPGNNHGGPLRSPRHKDVSSHEPGVMWVACVKKGDHPPFYDFDERYGEFEIIDVHDLWVSWELDCSKTTEIKDRRITGAESQEDVFEWFRDQFDLPPGNFRRPGYPKTEWKGNPWVLVEDDRTIASVHPWRTNGVWTITFAATCTN